MEKTVTDSSSLNGIAPLEARSLWRCEVYHVGFGDIVRRIPVLADGSRDPVRQDVFIGPTIIGMGGGPPMQMQFELDGPDLASAMASWPAKLAERVEALKTEAMRQAIASPRLPRAN